MTFTASLFQQCDLLTYSGDVTQALALSRTSTKFMALVSMDGTVGYRLGVDFTVSGASVIPTSLGLIVQLPSGSQLVAIYQYAGTAPTKTFDYQYSHVISYGQSLAIGERASKAYPTDTSILTTVRSFDALMFFGGTRALSKTSVTATAYGSLVALVEDADYSNATQLSTVYGIANPGETPISGCLDWIDTESTLEGSAATGYSFIGTAPGKGGTSIANLSSGTAPYIRLLDEVTRAKAFAVAASKTYGVPAVLWLQGEADAGNAAYSTSLSALFTSLNTDIKAITGQSKDVHFFQYQTANADYPAWAQYSLAASASNVHIAGPHYHLAKSDGTHFTAASSRTWGSYAGRAIKRQCINGVGWTCLKPTSWSFSGGNIILTLNSNAGLTLDSAGGAGAPGYGFTLTNGGGTPVTINSVAVTGKNTLLITPASAASAGFILYYGGAAGGVRDNQGLIERAGGVNTGAPLHNWLATFKQVL